MSEPQHDVGWVQVGQISADEGIVVNAAAARRENIHSSVRALLSGYLEGSFDSTERGHIERHLKQCPSCSAYLATLRKTVELAAELPRKTSPPAIKAAVLQDASSGAALVEGAPSPAAFELLIEEFGDRVYGIALRITGSPAAAEDATQDAFLAAFRYWASFRAEASPRTWLYRITVNAALQRVLGRPAEYLPEDEGELEDVRDWSGDVPEAAARAELLAELERGTALLPPDLRAALVLRDVEALSTAEAAAGLELSEAAVKSLLHRARALLRRFLQDYLAPSPVSAARSPSTEPSDPEYPMPEHGPSGLVTMMFDDEDEYVRFTDYVYEHFGGRGLELTNVPITTSVRVRPWLLEQTRARFAMRPVSREDVTRARERLAGQRPFDPERLKDFRVPGVPPPKRSP